VDFLAGLVPGDGSRRQRVLGSMAALEDYEAGLLERLLDGLASIDGVTRHGAPKSQTPTVLFSVRGHDGPAVHRGLAARGVNAPAGNFYALEASRHLGLADAGAVRAGLAPYTTRAEVDRLLAGVAELAAAPVAG
jgi:selenocysteine lyase/cysteine desulfurase